MSRDLGIVAIVMAAPCLLMGAVAFFVPEYSIGVGIGFVAVGVVLAAMGAWGISRGSSRPGPPAPPAGAADPPRGKRPKSKMGQILDGLTGFNG